VDVVISVTVRRVGRLRRVTGGRGDQRHGGPHLRVRRVGCLRRVTGGRGDQRHGQESGASEVDVVISVTVGRTCEALCGEGLGVTHSSRCFYGEVRPRLCCWKSVPAQCAGLRY